MSRGLFKFGIIFVAFLILGGLVFWSRNYKMKEEEAASGDSVKETPFQSEDMKMHDERVQLPSPRKESDISVEEAIQGRRSRRHFTSEPHALEELSQILWSAQGITDEAEGYRAAPSAGALYPLEVYVVVKEGGVEGLTAGVYHYLPENHSLEKILEKDLAGALARASLDQSFIGNAPISLVITAKYERTTGKYGERGRRYVHMEAGHAAQNVYLQVESLGLGTVVAGAFDDEKIKNLLQIPSSYEPLYIMAVGQPK